MPKIIDMENYPRKKHFDYFRSLPNPYVGLTAEVDVTALVDSCRRSGRSFFLAFMHAAVLAADSVAQFRQRIDGEGIVEYEHCPSSHTLLLDNGSYCYCNVKHNMDTDSYFLHAEKMVEEYRDRGSIDEDEDVQSMYFISSVPWLSYTALVQPSGDDSNPRITWGKYKEDFRGRLMMPVSVLVHHALMDGIHIAAFYKALDKLISDLAEEV